MMPTYLVTVEADGMGYPFLLEAPDRGRALTRIKRYWTDEGWGESDALRIDTVKKNRQGIACPNQMNVRAYHQVADQVHNCLLDMQDGQVNRDHLLRQLCMVLAGVLPESMAHEVFEIVGAHQRTSETEEAAAEQEHGEAIRTFKPQVVRRLAQETPTALPATLGNRKVKRL